VPDGALLSIAAHDKVELCLFVGTSRAEDCVGAFQPVLYVDQLRAPFYANSAIGKGLGENLLDLRLPHKRKVGEGRIWQCEVRQADRDNLPAQVKMGLGCYVCPG